MVRCIISLPSPPAGPTAEGPNARDARAIRSLVPVRSAAVPAPRHLGVRAVRLRGTPSRSLAPSDSCLVCAHSVPRRRDAWHSRPLREADSDSAPAPRPHVRDRSTQVPGRGAQNCRCTSRACIGWRRSQRPRWVDSVLARRTGHAGGRADVARGTGTPFECLRESNRSRANLFLREADPSRYSSGAGIRPCLIRPSGNICRDHKPCSCSHRPSG
ncbi:hypothetical protein B0H17DRAFT_67288 [Mycena rosella]|uniref:Uncharacterized protein n=1 Tax=Mycena rosella TaxID=1033263 RepID=A0AAD7E111_MYCRO|nr:hypothetical protein B0H17DRAFT_67288 [Mycena rosella]